MPASSSSRTARRLLQIATLGLAGLIAGLLAGCSGNTARALLAPNDTGWEMPSTYASATNTLSPRQAVRSTHLHMCSGEPCAAHTAVPRAPHSSHRVL